MVDITWWGHSTLTIRERGVVLLTDPLLTDRVAHLTRRRGSSPVRLTPDIVLISHLHHDHLHLPSLRRLPAGTRVVLPVGAAGLLAGLPLEVVEVAPGDRIDLPGVTLTAVRAVHDGRRHPGSTWWAPAVGYLVEGSARTWFAGDTGPADLLGADVGRVDVALVPVGGWGPVSRPSVRGQHLGPAEAADVCRRLDAELAIPIHYGTMWPSGLPLRASFRTPGDDFAARFGRARVLVPGETAVSR